MLELSSSAYSVCSRSVQSFGQKRRVRQPAAHVTYNHTHIHILSTRPPTRYPSHISNTCITSTETNPTHDFTPQAFHNISSRLNSPGFSLCLGHLHYVSTHVAITLVEGKIAFDVRHLLKLLGVPPHFFFVRSMANAQSV